MMTCSQAFRPLPIFNREALCPLNRTLKQVNNYVLRAKIGVGSSSCVYLATDVRTDQNHAIKRVRLQDLARNGDAISQLEREIRLMRQLKHPNILRLIEVLYEKESDEVYLVLELADKGCLGAFLERNQRLSEASVLSIVKQIAQAIKYLHENGFVHHDIKPWNILMDRTGRAILADFGIGHSFVSAAMVVGSPAYQAPECLDESYDDEDVEPCSVGAPQKEDIWALGVTLYQLLFMRLPYEGANLFEIVNAIKEGPIDIPFDTDPLIVELLHGMLKVDPTERFLIEDVLQFPVIRNASDLAADLPEVPKVEIKEGRAKQYILDVCSEEFSLAKVAYGHSRRRSLIGIDRMPSTQGFPSVTNNKSFPWELENRDSPGSTRSTGALKPLSRF